MGRHISALRKRGFPVRLSDAGKLIISKGTPDRLREQIISKRETIICELMTELENRRWVMIESSILGERVVLVKDETVKVPEQYHSLIRYTWAEANQLLDCPPGLLRMVHQSKRQLPGSTVEIIIDPRPDLDDDSDQWIRLLTYAVDSELYGPLHGMRCCGARLTRDGAGWQIAYDSIYSDGFADQDDFDDQYSLWIGDSAELTGLLKQLPGEGI